MLHCFLGKKPTEHWIQKFEVFYNYFIDYLAITTDKETILNIISILREIVN